MNEKKKIGSVEEFLKAIFSMMGRISIDNDPTNVFWFRGESHDFNKTSLVPSAYRILVDAINDDCDVLLINRGLDIIKDNELNITADFHREALPYIISRKIENTAWNRYFLMQHYKIQTRLLDWTENALLALFFAIIEDKKQEDNKDDAKVWILQPFNLNNHTIRTIVSLDMDFKVIPAISDTNIKQEIFDESGKMRLDELTRRYLKMDFNQKSMNAPLQYYPLAIFPSFLDQRMAAQKSCFTIFGNITSGLQSLDCSDILDYVIIDGIYKKSILNELRLIGIDFSSIYPDLDGLGMSIAKKYEQEYKKTGAFKIKTMH